MKIAVVGSRDYPDLDRVTRFVHDMKSKHGRPWIISGHARGVDRAAEDASIKIALPTLIFPADWFGELGKGAGFDRNSDIVNEADAVAAFWDGQSRGTLDSVRKARAGGKYIRLFGPNGETIDADSIK